MIVGDKVRFFNLTGPWAAFNDAYDGNSGQVQAYDVTSIVNSTTIDMGTTASGIGTVNPSGFANYAGGGTAQRCRQASGNWMRPFSALSGATNGTGVNDVGAANLGMPLRTWPVTWAANRTYAYRYDYYGHADYASLLDTWFADDGNTNHLTNCYRGSDFWVQFRCKISASRWQDYNAPVRNPDSLKMFSIWSWETPFHEVVINDANTPKAPYSTYPASAGGVLDGYTSQGYSKTFWKGNHMQPLGDYDGTCLWTGQFPALVNSCWHMPPDEWVCFLLHVIPGKTVPNWGQDPDQNSPGHPLPGGWPNMTNYLGQDLTASATGIQLWACTQSRINTMKAANQTVTYQSLINCTGSNGFPFVYDNWQAPYAPADPPPGFHNLALLTYQNNIPVTFGWTRDYCQVIFKKGNGGTTVADGIPCPQI
jgi:hypothetical protein